MRLFYLAYPELLTKQHAVSAVSVKHVKSDGQTIRHAVRDELGNLVRQRLASGNVAPLCINLHLLAAVAVNH